MQIAKLCQNTARFSFANGRTRPGPTIGPPTLDLTGRLNHNRRQFGGSHNASNRGNPKLPDLLYVPHLFRWLCAKYRLKYLQKMWDPEFTEGAFIYGSTHAICRITDIISRNRPDELKTLVDERACVKLKKEITHGLTEHQRRAIRLQPDDIKLLVPMRVRFDTKNYQRRCGILLKILAMKWFSVGNGSEPPKLVLVIIETEFNRDYASGPDSQWNITMFNILQCTLVNNRLP